MQRAATYPSPVPKAVPKGEPDPDSMVTTYVRLPPGEKATLEEQATKERLHLSDLLRRAVRQYLEARSDPAERDEDRERMLVGYGALITKHPKAAADVGELVALALDSERVRQWLRASVDLLETTGRPHRPARLRKKAGSGGA